MVVVSLWDFEVVGVGVGVGVGVSEVEVESVGVGVLLADGVLLGVVEVVGVGVEEALLGVVVLSPAVDAVVEDAAAVPNTPPAKPPSAESTPPSRSFSTISRREGFELSQLACASAQKTVIRVKTRNCCCRENIFAMVSCVCAKEGRKKKDGVEGGRNVGLATSYSNEANLCVESVNAMSRPRVLLLSPAMK